MPKIEKVKKRIPNISLSTDIIVVFSNGNKGKILRKHLTYFVRLERMITYSHLYIQDEGTPAAKLDFVLTDEEIHENFNKLLEVQNEISKTQK